MAKKEEQYEVGMIGLGVMGRNLLLNMADHGFSVAGYDKDKSKVEALRQEAENRDVRGATDIKEFLSLLKRPRAVMMLVPAGAPVDSVIKELEPLLQSGDLVIDGGNSYFKDTNLRAGALAGTGIQFLGVGVSGGEEGARHGPSIMPGGPKEAYERVRPLLEAASAKVGNEPCVTWLGPGSAGHFVKMVHNGIEYGIMQLIAESYDIMKRGLGLNDDELHDTYDAWNSGDLNGYLVEITSHIFKRADEKTGKRLVDEILDVAKQKGTGMWTSQSAMELHVPIPTIDIAVTMRNMSMLETQRQKAGGVLGEPGRRLDANRKDFVRQLGRALYAGVLVCYAQGMSVLKAASDSYAYKLDLEAVARIWRGGCIIRAALLENIRSVYRRQPDLPNLLLDKEMSQKVKAGEADLRAVVTAAARYGLAAPGFMSALGYIDSFRSPWLPANLVQAQRDYFGAHTYERVDAKGTFHTEWEKG